MMDAERGHAWEETIVLLPPPVKLVLLSATISSPSLLASWVGDVRRVPCVCLSTAYRIVPLVHGVSRKGAYNASLVAAVLLSNVFIQHILSCAQFLVSLALLTHPLANRVAIYFNVYHSCHRCSTHSLSNASYYALDIITQPCSPYAPFLSHSPGHHRGGRDLHHPRREELLQRARVSRVVEGAGGQGEGRRGAPCKRGCEQTRPRRRCSRCEARTSGYAASARRCGPGRRQSGRRRLNTCCEAAELLRRAE